LKRLEPIARNSFAGDLVAQSVEIFLELPQTTIAFNLHNLLEISTAMKRTSLSKSARSIALIVAISSPGLQQPAPAQGQNTCVIASSQGPRSSFDKVNLSPTQESAFNAFGKKYDALAIRFNARAKKIIKPNAPVGFFIKQTGRNLTPFEQQLSDKAGNSKPSQIPALNAKYAQYGRFVPETTLVYDQALFEEYQREVKLLDDQSLTVMTPAQRQQYQQNQAALKKVNQICKTQDGPFVKVGNSYEMGGSYY
jgi:hypothetical protein